MNRLEDFLPKKNNDIWPEITSEEIEEEKQLSELDINVWAKNLEREGLIGEIMSEDELDKIYQVEPEFPDYLLYDSQIVGYPDQEFQVKIYDWVKTYLPNSNYTIKDLGSGRGDFHGYLNDCGVDNVEYFGIEMNSNLYNVSRKKYPEAQVFNQDYLKLSIESDYTIVIGTLNDDLMVDKWDNFNKTLNYAISNTETRILMVLQADCYGNPGSVDYPLNELVQFLPKEMKFIIDYSEIEDIYLLVIDNDSHN